MFLLCDRLYRYHFRQQKRCNDQNGSKACAWLIYKSAAKLTVRLTPHRHPRRFAPRAPKPSARPNKQSGQTEIKGGDGAGVRR